MVYRDPHTESRCALCDTLLTAESHERFASLLLCRPCFEGDFGQRLEDRGIRLQQLTLATRQLNEYRTPRRYTFVCGATSHDLSLQASFGREDFISRIGKLFRPELKVGDPLFDDDVFIRTDDPDALQELLGSQSMQSVIHTAVSELAEHELPLVIDGPRAQLRSQETPSASGSDYLRRVVGLVLHHLARDAAGRGIAPSRERAQPLLDLQQACSQLISGEKLYGLFVRFDRFDDLQQLAWLKRDGGHDRLEQIGLNDLRLGSSDLSPLASIPGLVGLSLARVIDVVDLSGLADAVSLRRLDLHGCPVSDLGPLATLNELEELDLRDTAVDDLGPIMKLGRMRRIDVRGSRVPARQIEQLVAAIPGLEVDPD
jgi:hypothetical protein